MTTPKAKSPSLVARFRDKSRRSFHNVLRQRELEHEEHILPVSADKNLQQFLDDGRKYAARQPARANSARDPVPRIVLSTSSESLRTIEDSQFFYSGQHMRSASTGDISGPYESNADIIRFELLKHWIQTCEDEHEKTCGVPGHPSTNADHTQDALQIMLIDVEQLRLVEATTAGRYFALSYVWGGVQQLNTTKASKDILTKPFALQGYLQQIPQVIRDAMVLVKSLGERYLWVDALSIVQDDAEIKHHQISNMSEIYRHAVVTIVSIAGQDANSHLPGVMPGTRLRQTGRSMNITLSRPLRPDLAVKAVNRSVYASRGWCFQERLLSRRCLYFLDEQTYFQCQCQLWCEEEPPPFLDSMSVALGPSDIALNVLSSLPEWVDNMRCDRWGLVFDFYARLVEEYTRKGLSYSSDVLKAFRGVLSILKEYSGWTFAFGLPEQFIERALLWIPNHPTTRRVAAGSEMPFPSWCWSGWIGGVNFSWIVRNTESETFLDHSELLTYAHNFAESIDGRTYLAIQDSVIENPRTQGVKRTIHKLRNLPAKGHDWVRHRQMATTLEHLSEDLATLSRQSWGKSRPDADPRWLKFRTATLPLDGFRFSIQSNQMCDYPGDETVETTGALPGIWVLSKSGIPCGFLYSVTLDDLEKHHAGRLLFAVISTTLRAPSVWEVIPYGRAWSRTLPWQCLNVMLLVKVGDCFERVAVGQLDQAAWKESRSKHRKIVLV